MEFLPINTSKTMFQYVPFELPDSADIVLLCSLVDWRWSCQNRCKCLQMLPDTCNQEILHGTSIFASPACIFCQFSAQELQQDPAVVLKAVSLKGCALRFAASHLRRDTQARPAMNI